MKYAGERRELERGWCGSCGDIIECRHGVVSPKEPKVDRTDPEDVRRYERERKARRRQASARS